MEFTPEMIAKFVACFLYRYSKVHANAEQRPRHLNTLEFRSRDTAKEL